jgi:inosine-uridine nucleoside N-ribohydrolase
MGGCFLFPGNVSTNAEANIWNDPFAANLVFSTFSSVHLAPLDVTCSIRWGSEFLAKLKVRAPILGDFIEKIAKKYIEFHDHILGIPVCDFHDSSAVIALVAPHLFTLRG